MLHFYADRGDIQTTVSALLALDDKAKGEEEEERRREGRRGGGGVGE